MRTHKKKVTNKFVLLANPYVNVNSIELVKCFNNADKGKNLDVLFENCKAIIR